MPETIWRCQPWGKEMMEQLDLSIVVPVYNEEENLRPLLAEITAALKDEPLRYEVIFIDDGSSDTSFTVMEALHEADNRVVAIQFRRNHGQTAAFAAGFEQARGRYILTIDADRQNDIQHGQVDVDTHRH